MTCADPGCRIKCFVKGTRFLEREVLTCSEMTRKPWGLKYKQDYVSLSRRELGSLGPNYVGYGGLTQGSGPVSRCRNVLCSKVCEPDTFSFCGALA